MDFSLMGNCRLRITAAEQLIESCHVDAERGAGGDAIAGVGLERAQRQLTLRLLDLGADHDRYHFWRHRRQRWRRRWWRRRRWRRRRWRRRRWWRSRLLALGWPHRRR